MVLPLAEGGRVLPLLYLHGLSSGDFVPALAEFFGSKAGLSASMITRLTTTWPEEQRRFAERDLSDIDYVYLWVDGVHFTVRLDDDPVCTLVMVGVRADGRKELVALADGHRESTTSWADLPAAGDARAGARGRRGAGVQGAARGVPGHPRVAGLGAQGRHRAGLLPKSAQPAARKALAEIRDAEDRAHAQAAIDRFAALFGAKYPKAVAKVVDDREQRSPIARSVRASAAILTPHGAPSRSLEGCGEPSSRRRLALDRQRVRLRP